MEYFTCSAYQLILLKLLIILLQQIDFMIDMINDSNEGDNDSSEEVLHLNKRRSRNMPSESDDDCSDILSD